tara:strand:- start:166 stop:681 length:516 start_codon:yes stop_codon:yes gene_type:complete
MGNIEPLVLMDLINRDGLDVLDQVVYDCTKKFVELTNPTLLNAVTSHQYQLKFVGKMVGQHYFSFVGAQGKVLADYLSQLPNNLLWVAKDSTFMGHIEEAEKNPLIQAVIPMSWIYARQMNQGLYDEAAQFDIRPPCLRLMSVCDPEKMGEVIEELASTHNKIKNYQFKIK